MSTFKIREVGPADDFEHLNNLIKRSLQKSLESENLRARYFMDAESLRQQYLPSTEQTTGQQLERSDGKGFVAESDGVILAFAGVQLSDDSKNGYISVGFTENHEQILAALVQRCEEVVKEAGGKQLCKYSTLLPGKIRNQEISFWEKFGFIADDYFHALIKLEVDEWEPPVKLDTANISPASDIELDNIISILNEEGQDELAKEFREMYPHKTPEHVFLTLQNEQKEITAISYYQVVKFKDKNKAGKFYDGFGAFGAGIHFRSSFQISRKEKRRFIQATVQSMKELNIIFASSRISSKDFDAFIEMLAEGFYFQGEDQTVQIRLTKQV